MDPYKTPSDEPSASPQFYQSDSPSNKPSKLPSFESPKEPYAELISLSSSSLSMGAQQLNFLLTQCNTCESVQKLYMSSKGINCED